MSDKRYDVDSEDDYLDYEFDHHGQGSGDSLWEFVTVVAFAIFIALVLLHIFF